MYLQDKLPYYCLNAEKLNGRLATIGLSGSWLALGAVASLSQL